MEPEKLMDGISKDMNIALKAMGKAKTSEEKLVYSKIVNNLSQSLGVFLSLVSDMGLFDDDGEPIPF